MSDLSVIHWKDARAVAIMYDLHEKYKGGACEPLGRWLVARAKRTWPRFAGYRFFRKTNVKRAWVVVSYHHPAQLCWSWLVSFDLFPPRYGKCLGNSFGRTWLKVPYLFGISLSRQPHYAWMLSSTAKMRLQAIAQQLDEGSEQ